MSGKTLPRKFYFLPQETMVVQVLLCLYLLLFVIDFVFVGLRSHEQIWIRLGRIHLLFFLCGLVRFRNLFQQLATQHHHRLVFTPLVLGFFSFALGGLIQVAVTQLAWNGLGALLRCVLFWFLFRTISVILDISPVRKQNTTMLIVRMLISVVAAVAYWRIPMLSGTLFPTLQERLMPTTTQSGVDIADISGTAQTGTIVVPEENTGQVVTGAVGSEGTKAVLETTISDPTGPLTYSALLTHLDQRGLLGTAGGELNFQYVSRTDPLYPIFVRAWNKRMIGTNIQPNRQVRCNNLMIIYGLAKNRSVSTTSSLFQAYRDYATTQGVLGSCREQSQVASRDMLDVLQ